MNADYVPSLVAIGEQLNVACEECGEGIAYTLICVDGTNMAVCRPCHIWLDHHSVPARIDGDEPILSCGHPGLPTDNYCGYCGRRVGS